MHKQSVKECEYPLKGGQVIHILFDGKDMSQWLCGLNLVKASIFRGFLSYRCLITSE